MKLCEFNDAANERVLRRAVDKERLLEARRDGKERRRRHVVAILLDGVEEVGRRAEARLVDARLGCRGPHDDDRLEAVRRLEARNVAAQHRELACAAAQENVVCTRSLIARDERGRKGSRQRH